MWKQVQDVWKQVREVRKLLREVMRQDHVLYMLSVLSCISIAAQYLSSAGVRVLLRLGKARFKTLHWIRHNIIHLRPGLLHSSGVSTRLLGFAWTTGLKRTTATIFTPPEVFAKCNE
ncbi:hypothetical protein Y1Q_0004687 [Alligator mississippiensis]|uniref:Uncharacterized protein n=1 Tax=Alligator mississippiensis TaxID=8496 RepID=A0A151P6A0_ALLMI|nr:hypothetical protein Y1Q_0004687 [Alligator mississippiensis]